MTDTDALPLTLSKRWRLRDGVTPDDVRSFVDERIQPMYRRLSTEVELGLGVATDGRSIVAVQRWSNAAAHRAATTDSEYDAWWAEYEPILAEWDQLVVFDHEWATYEIALRDQ